MIYFKLYFWIAVISVAAVYLLVRKNDSKFIFSEFFPSYIHFAVSILGAFIVGTFYNHDYQIYCQPVTWTKCLLLFISLWFLALPLLKRNNLINGLLSGLAVFISIYLILFGSFEYLGFIVINAIFFIPASIVAYLAKRFLHVRFFGFLHFFGILILLPYVILFLVIRSLIKSGKTAIRLSMIFPVLIILSSVFVAIKMKEINDKIISGNYDKTVVRQFTQNKIDRYFLELCLGVHWKYHTRICLYDGRRPPFHNPVLVLGRTFGPIIGGFEDVYPEVSLGKGLYQYAFPENATTFNCQCGKHERWPEDFD